MFNLIHDNTQCNLRQAQCTCTLVVWTLEDTLTLLFCCFNIQNHLFYFKMFGGRSVHRVQWIWRACWFVDAEVIKYWNFTISILWNIGLVATCFSGSLVMSGRDFSSGDMLQESSLVISLSIRRLWWGVAFN